MWIKRMLSLIGCGVVLGAATVAHAGDQLPATQWWIERPWEFRYFIRIDTVRHMKWGIKDWQESLQAPKVGGLATYEGIFPYSEVARLRTSPHDDDFDRSIAKLVIEFDESGNIKTPHTGPQGLAGHLNRLYSIVLAAGSTESDWYFKLGHWYTGRSDDDLVFAPAICNYKDMDDSTAEIGRYRKGFAAGFTHGNFGCREWGYYLKSDEHPYIDITSYQWEDDETKPANKKGRRPKKLVAYVHATTGWGRFDVPPKPVIGKAFDTWVCFHECPNGEAHGIIPDIKAWAKANSWPVPKPPKKQPMFPDREFKRGEFID